MANFETQLLGNSIIRVTFNGRQDRHIRITDLWTDWMLAIDDFRDLIIPLSNDDVDFIITELLNNKNILNFNIINNDRQEFSLLNNKKIVRRLDAGNIRKEYQTVALFIENNNGQWLPDPVEIHRDEILSLIRAMITLDCPPNYCVRDSLRNLQYLLSILWVKRENPKLLQGIKKPDANEIFRISLIK